ncbi:MAG TPA: ribose-5-phosphate isomerase RpiA [Pseudonocardia sp.]|uniref:ribose-5-phosphate isomerase RpiA n=1 Tax=Pseudonocardia sp. TaxID=60912 RepID=UPI002C39FE46|nr:ribose-5-phosphate isomerase RpiA [Pseudonocardia sp.]HTF48836.1 ribose-5-phosphate isomerase RpiA [Pseudonocardia sp.]
MTGPQAAPVTSAPSADGLSGQDVAKRAAGRRAARSYCKNGMKLGLGSGTTSHWFVRELAELVRAGLDVVGVPTSTATRDLARDLGIRLADLNDLGELDLTIDGPDEIDHQGNMIKGGGACLWWEKIVARASRRMVVVADDTKVVDRLGAFPLPLEVLPFGWVSSQRLIRELLADTGYPDGPLERRVRNGELVVTDSGNYLLDAHLGAVHDPGALATALNQIPGVVENGLFVGIADQVVLGHPDDSAEVVGIPLPVLD